MFVAFALMVTYTPTLAFADDGEASDAPEDAQKSVQEVQEQLPQLNAETPSRSVNSGSAGENLTWTLSEDGTLTISGTGEMNIEDDLFYDINDETPITKVVLEEGVTTVSREAFSYCYDLSEVYIPLSLEFVGEEAFYSCDISNVFYAGSYDEWNNIVKEDGNWDLENAKLHLYYGTDKQDDLIIVYILQGGTLDGKPLYMEEAVGECMEDYELPEPVRTGYIFDYWYDSNDDEVSVIEAGTKGTVILWAEWSGLNYDEYVSSSTVMPDIPVAVNGSAYSAEPIKFYTGSGIEFEVSYVGREIKGDFEGPYEELTQKYGLTFAEDGKISGTVSADEDKEIELTAGVAEKKDGELVGYNEYTIWLNIVANPEKYDIPDDAAEMDLTNVNGGGWYKTVSKSDEWTLPYYTYTVAAGESKWVKFRVASDILNVESGSGWNTPVKIVGEDGYVRYSHSDEYGIGEFPANPGGIYYIYVDNTKGSEDEIIYVNDCGDHAYDDGALGNWRYKRIRSKVVNPFVKNSGKDWDVYRIGTFDDPYNWTINGFNTGVYYYCSVDVISPNPVYYSGPAFNANFGTNYSVYKNNYLSWKEENLKLASGEKHRKINYKIKIADTEYVTGRQNTCNVDFYVPAGTSITKDKKNYLHAALIKTSLTKVIRAKKAFTAKWTKKSGISGYQIQYSLKSNFSGARKVTVNKPNATYKKITNLKSKKRYYVRIRTYRKVGSKTYYSAWSAKKTVTTN